MQYYIACAYSNVIYTISLSYILYIMYVYIIDRTTNMSINYAYNV